MKKIILSAVVLLAGFSAANAQATLSASQTVTIKLQNSISIDITGGTGNSFTFGSTSAYETGLTNANAATFQVKSNRPWAVTVKAAAANFTGPALPATVMPSSVLSVKLSTGTGFGALSATAAALTSGLRGNSSFSIDYNANPGFLYDAGDYTMSVVYTATQQ